MFVNCNNLSSDHFSGVGCFRRDGQSLERFLGDYFSGRLKPYIKSEPVPERNTAPIKVNV